MIKYDTYHDTSDQLPHGARVLSAASPWPVVMEAGTTDRTSLAEKKKDGPSRAMLKSFLLSVLHV
jgi:hypothetical protein